MRRTQGRIAILFCLTVVVCLGQPPRQNAILNLPIDQTTAVSFFYIGDMWSHWRDPMNFYAAAVDDPRLHTLHIDNGPHSKGWETWITTTEMRFLTEKLVKSDLEWSESKKVEVFQGKRNRRSGDWFDITVISSKGTAKARIRLTRMCDELRQLDSVMATPRILWQFQTLRWDDGCIIPGYKNEARPKG